MRRKQGGGKILIVASQESLENKGTFYYNIFKNLPSQPKQELLNEEVLEILILWINRILFLKLLESSLISFNEDKNLAFLNTQKIPSYTQLNELFFEVLAKPYNERPLSHLSYLPYLNSSLFIRNEKETITIAELSDLELEYFHHTQIKDSHQRKKQGKVKWLQYLFSFLDAFDFGVLEDTKELMEQKELINSSVLGLVFEKLNGYKEGSFYTPSFITSYMCKKALEQAVVEKFNEVKAWDCKDIKALRLNLDRLTYKESNEIFNSLRICDPAVGSGHFLVSVLNELMNLKFELGILCQKEGTEYKRLKDITLNLHNDEILLKDHENKNFSYKKPKHENIESHKIQKALFENKKDLIEACLFGVDLNPNSVQICRLRLWIELLKNTYYKSFEDLEYHDLETLPNIDINIKCGNSLISYFDEKFSLSHYPNIKVKMQEYKQSVQDYKENLGNKTHMDKRIKALLETFKNFCFNDKYKKEIKALNTQCDSYSKKYGDYLAQEDENLRKFIPANFGFLDFDENEAKKEFQQLQKAYDSLYNLESKKPLEWRFEFPEVLDDEGNFKGFDVVIGNPPYIRQEEIKHLKPQLQKAFSIYKGTSDIYTYFFEQGYKILKPKGILSFITSNKWCRAGYGEKLREFLLHNTTINQYLDLNGVKVFAKATVDTSILEWTKSKAESKHTLIYAHPKDYDPKSKEALESAIKEILLIPQASLSKEAFIFSDPSLTKLRKKIEAVGTPLKDWDINIYRGVLTGYNEAFMIDSEKRKELSL